MKRYDHTQTRQGAIEKVLDKMLAPLDDLGYKRIKKGTVDRTRISGTVLTYGPMPALGDSERVPSDLGRGHYTWTDRVGVEAVFSAKTDEFDDLRQSSYQIAHDIERAAMRYVDDGEALVDNEEVLIFLHDVDFSRQRINIVVTKDRAAVLVHGTITTGVAWKT